MWKYAAIGLLLLLPACDGARYARDGVLSIVAPITNPISRSDLYAAESVYGATYAAAVAYRRLCVQKAIPSLCRNVVLKLQASAKKAQAALVAARNFVKNNPTVSAVSIIFAARTAINDFQAVAAANGVK